MSPGSCTSPKKPRHNKSHRRGWPRGGMTCATGRRTDVRREPRVFRRGRPLNEFLTVRHPLLRRMILVDRRGSADGSRWLSTRGAAVSETRIGLQAALNGDRTKAAHAAVPASAEELT